MAAEEKLQYTVTLATRATGDGAKKTADDIKQVGEEAKTVSAHTDQAGSKLQKIGTSATNSGIQMGKMGNLANQASFQLGDFFTQVEMGTSATTAFSQQAPQLIGALSMAGMVSGPAGLALAGVGAAIPLLAMALPALGKAFGDVAAVADTFATSLGEGVKKAIDGIGELDTKRIDEANSKLSLAVENEISLSKKYDETGKAEAKATTAALDHAEKNRAAQVLVAEAMGLQVDAYQQIAEAAALAEAKRNETANQEIDGANDQVKKAANEAWAISQRQGLKATALNDRKEELETAKAALEILRQQSAEYEKMARAKVGFFDFAGARTKADAGNLYSQTQDKIKAQQGLVDSREASLKRAQSAYDATAAAFDSAMVMVDDQNAAVGVQIESLKTSLEQDNLNARAVAVVDQGKELVSGLSGAIQELEPTTQAGIQAKESIMKALADGKVTSDEMAGMISNLTQLMGSIQIGFTTVNGNAETVKQIMASFAVQQQSQQADLKRLWAQMERNNSTGSSLLPAR